MRRLLILTCLLLSACVTTPRVSVHSPSDRSISDRQRDVLECQALANQAAQGEGGWTSVAPMRQAIFEQARDRWLLECLRSRGYVITTH